MEQRIIKLRSVLKDYVWGGTKIRDVLRKEFGENVRVAESWEISTHPDGQTVVGDGDFRGKTLNGFFDEFGWSLVGEYGETYRQLPVMVKYIDAKNNLSIQVHPDDGYARAHENDHGKNEAWFIIEAEEGAYIYLGFNRDVTRDEVRESIRHNSLENLLNKVYVKRGEVYRIPAGTVHAIGAGCLICEVQQTSNLTYRMYDYGRLGLDGKPRELHVDKALAVVNCKRFSLADHQLTDRARSDEFFGAIFSGRGQCRLHSYDGAGDFCIGLPADRAAFAVVYGGQGRIAAGDREISTCCGDTWLVTGRNLTLSGECNALVILL